MLSRLLLLQISLPLAPLPNPSSSPRHVNIESHRLSMLGEGSPKPILRIERDDQKLLPQRDSRRRLRQQLSHDTLRVSDYELCLVALVHEDPIKQRHIGG